MGKRMRDAVSARNKREKGKGVHYISRMKGTGVRVWRDR